MRAKSNEEPAEREPGMLIRALTGMLACHDLPEEPPADPMPTLLAWFKDAETRGNYEDFNAMTLATATADGRPSARVVLCKAIEAQPPAVVFYTNYESRKGMELAENPNAAATFHWPHARRQVRIEGRVERTTPEESDAYFKSRPLLSRIASAASRQSATIASREELIAEAVRVAGRMVGHGDVPRPANWGGFRILPRRVELWSARSGRLHDRIVWDRTHDGGWEARRLSA
ncbi:MAG: pyridoxamine 5'-phosphate oxidase [Phycisphaeraceae bacterium]|nr:pyridoxamine 5'-phosphate oxidase [Phycisphaeraceae bacterium]